MGMKHSDSSKTHFRRKWIERIARPYSVDIPRSFKRQVLKGDAIIIGKRGNSVRAICKHGKRNYDIIYSYDNNVCVTVYGEF